jgi:hypothetical protein
MRSLLLCPSPITGGYRLSRQVLAAEEVVGA